MTSLPIIVKGILSPEDAVAAAEAGTMGRMIKGRVLRRFE